MCERTKRSLCILYLVINITEVSVHLPICKLTSCLAMSLHFNDTRFVDTICLKISLLLLQIIHHTMSIYKKTLQPLSVTIQYLLPNLAGQYKTSNDSFVVYHFLIQIICIELLEGLYMMWNENNIFCISFGNFYFLVAYNNRWPENEQLVLNRIKDRI